MTYNLSKALLNQKLQENESPLSTLADGSNIQYIVYGARTIGNVTGYVIKKIDSGTTNAVYITSGFLPESLRVSGANGSGANVNLQGDLANSLLLLTDSSISYG